MSACDAIAAEIESFESQIAALQGDLLTAPDKAKVLAEIVSLTHKVKQKRADLALCLSQLPPYETDVTIIDLAPTAPVVRPGDGTIWKFSDTGQFPLERRAIEHFERRAEQVLGA